MAHFQKISGTISAIDPSRTFLDGVFCKRVEFTKATGQRSQLEKVFFTLKLSAVLRPQTSGEFFFWNSHCYGHRSDKTLNEDIDGARASYFKRDWRLLLLMACSIVLIPAVLFILLKKLFRAGSRRQMEEFLAS